MGLDGAALAWLGGWMGLYHGPRSRATASLGANRVGVELCFAPGAECIRRGRGDHPSDVGRLGSLGKTAMATRARAMRPQPTDTRRPGTSPKTK